MAQAASSAPRRMFVAVGVVLILPLNIAYLAYAHWVFRGKQDKLYAA